MSQIAHFTAGGGAGITAITGNVGGAVNGLAGNINIVGAGGVTVTGNPGTNTLTITAVIPAGFTWTEAAGPAVPLVVANGYILNNAGLVTATLPAAAAVGTIIAIVGKGAGLYTIAQGAGQTIHFDDIDTTPGVGGSLTATNRYDCIELICITANSDWVVRSSVGNFTIV